MNEKDFSKRVMYCLVVVSIAVLISILTCGCLENTARGLGGFVQGTGELVTGIGSDIVRASDGYGNQK